MNSRVDLDWHGDRVKALIHAAAADGAELAAEHLLSVSNNLVPIETAVLQDSGTTSVDRGKGKAAVSYDTEYAIYQHEVEELEHDPGRTWKYLEGPMHTEAPVLKAIIAKTVKDRLK